MRHRNLFVYLFFLGVLVLVGCGLMVSVQTDPIPTTLTDEGSLPFPAPMINPTAAFRTELPVYSMALSPTGRYLALGSRKRIILWDAAKPEETRVLDGGTRDILSLAFSPDEKTLAAGSYINIDLLDVNAGQRTAFLPGHADYVHSLAFSPDGRWLASGSGGTETAIHVWDLSDKRLVRRMTYRPGYSERVRALAFSPDGRWLASLGLDRLTRVWEIDMRRRYSMPHQVLFDPATTPITASFSPDQKILVSGTAEGRIVLYDLTEGAVLKTLSGHEGEVLSVVFSRDGRTLISTGRDRTIRRWDVETGKAIEAHEMKDDVQFGKMTSDGTVMAAAGPLGAALFKLEEPKGTPLVITLLTPVDRQTVNQSVIQLVGKIVDDAGVIGFRILVNDVLLKDNSEAEIPAEIFLDEVISLDEGENMITVTAYNRAGISRTETILVTYVPEEGEM